MRADPAVRGSIPARGGNLFKCKGDSIGYSLSLSTFHRPHMLFVEKDVTSQVINPSTFIGHCCCCWKSHNGFLQENGYCYLFQFA